MADGLDGAIVDTLTLRFTGSDENGEPIHELRASHVAEVLSGLVGLAGDFDKAGAFNYEGASGSEILVRPAEEGSFIIEAVRVVNEMFLENAQPVATAMAAAGVPSLATIIWWSTKSARATVKDFTYLDNGNVKILWQDDTADEVPRPVWEELNKRKVRRKKHLRQIMAPMGDPRVEALDVTNPVAVAEDAPAPANDGEEFVLERPDYDAVTPEDEIEENQRFFEVEAQMSAIDFDDPTKWRVKTEGSQSRSVSVEDPEFLERVSGGLAIRNTDIFRILVREDETIKNGRSRTNWTVLKIESHRRAAGDDDAQSRSSTTP